MRSVVVPLTVLCALAWTSEALAGGGGCGNVTFEGECKGTTLRYCDEGSLIEQDCTKDSPMGTCRFYSDDYGFDCAEPVGGDCLFIVEDDEIQQFGCAGNESACVEDIDGSMCTENQGTCTSTDTSFCRGDQYVFNCADFGQPHLIDCPSFGASCRLGTGCFGVAEGGFCDDVSVFCAVGLNCVADECSSGTSTPTPMVDAGTPDLGTADAADIDTPDVGFGFPDARASGGGNNTGSGGRTDDSGCGCQLTETTGASWMVWAGALFLFLMVRRRSS